MFNDAARFERLFLSDGLCTLRFRGFPKVCSASTLAAQEQSAGRGMAETPTSKRGGGTRSARSST
ncbi:hypothetical protein ABZ572_33780 [Streptomyces sp. NPDC018338]|uniref:hypothetical protein n=1 Tax=Streptomyces sp. NPDC018338 TaxID=3157192 RepID=UPI00340E9355